MKNEKNYGLDKATSEANMSILASWLTQYKSNLAIFHAKIEPKILYLRLKFNM
jgi:hypothetical protein